MSLHHPPGVRAAATALTLLSLSVGCAPQESAGLDVQLQQDGDAPPPLANLTLGIFGRNGEPVCDALVGGPCLSAFDAETQGFSFIAAPIGPDEGPDDDGATDPPGTGPDAVAEEPLGELDSELCWPDVNPSDDPRYAGEIAFVTVVGSGYDARSRIQVASGMGEPARPISPVGLDCTSPAWSPDGVLLAYVCSRGATAYGTDYFYSHLFVAERNLETGEFYEPVNVTTALPLDTFRARDVSHHQPSWGPASGDDYTLSAIYGLPSAVDYVESFTITRLGGAPVVSNRRQEHLPTSWSLPDATRSRGDIAAFAWSPDFTEIAFLEIYRELDGGRVSVHEERLYSWDPDNDDTSYVSPDDITLWTTHSADPRQLVSWDEGYVTQCSGARPSYSPDGTQISLTAPRGGTEQHMVMATVTRPELLGMSDDEVADAANVSEAYFTDENGVPVDAVELITPRFFSGSIRIP